MQTVKCGVGIYTTIEINFRDGGSVIIEENQWDDYNYVDGFIVIKKDKAWVAMYNAKDVFSVTLKR